MGKPHRVTVRLKGVTLSYPHFFEKKASIDGGREKYRGNIIMYPSTKEGKAAIALCEDAVADIIDVTWNGKIDKEDFKTDRWPLMNGNKMKDRDKNVRVGYEDSIFLRTSSDKRPKLKKQNGRDDIERDEEDDFLYGGAIVDAWVTFYSVTDTKAGGDGIFTAIEAVQFRSKGTPFGNAGISDEEFEDLGEGDVDGEEDRSSRRRSRDDEDRPSRRSRDEDDRPSRRDRDDDRSSRRDRDEDRSARRRSRDDDEV